MEKHYKLHRLRDLAEGDEAFINMLVETFLEEVPADAIKLKKAVETNNFEQAYQSAHKMKPTIDVFELGVLNELILVQDWGKFEKKADDITKPLKIVLNAIENTVKEIKTDFNL